ncbi:MULTISPECIES: TetR/AcrR family transcriptional regulator [unclassified Erysipelothrix]|uniref:TetR/AcrR family transcriptional regulator n=1 Tax=unclassified Erysipelothrix TaxID=2624170 RepID=UPI0013788DB3|nr:MULTISPECIES: TetR/AcrR family transcriptional regulator [unclassified Erysipelothrix]MBK2403002.1 TetR/AcrR family transcriptional regulator [Erysipelothrix sp. strain 2 (EsS2-6-Brazil)]MBK2403502.1 TetR/AcrR family transcriptional regulator [Erysipelothrix sp. strain 2 (EsS2-7-Brazil)]NBA01547.1 TetR family transcriptional regulator [Erysipelothrix rhusiopathiae]
MPKIIHNIEEEIFASAEHLFYLHDYEDVSMKMIAKETNIAVGTLYNYYRDKASLYAAVVHKSWADTFARLKNCITTEVDFNAKFRKRLEVLYYDSEKRHGLGVHFKRVRGMNAESLEDLQGFVLTNIKEVFKDMPIANPWVFDTEIITKLIYSLLSNLSFLIENYPFSKEDNIDFLYHSLIAFFH